MHHNSRSLLPEVHQSVPELKNYRLAMIPNNLSTAPLAAIKPSLCGLLQQLASSLLNELLQLRQLPLACICQRRCRGPNQQNAQRGMQPGAL